MQNTGVKTKNKLHKKLITVILVILLAAVLLISFGEPFGAPSWNDLFAFASISAKLDDGLSLSFINVGYADACYIKCGDKNVLVDCGRSLSYNKLKAYLKRNGCTHFDAAIISHTDSDHIGSMAEIIRDFGADKIYMPPYENNNSTENDDYVCFVNAVDKYDVTVLSPNIPSHIDIGDMSFSFISPRKNYKNSNDNSLVFRMIYKNNSFLFTGDISKTVETDILNSNSEIKSDVLKVAHHGSKSSSSLEFLKAADPEISVVSAGNSDISIPDYNTMAIINSCSQQLYCTNKDKTVVIVSDGNKLEVKTHS